MYSKCLAKHILKQRKQRESGKVFLTCKSDCVFCVKEYCRAGSVQMQFKDNNGSQEVTCLTYKQQPVKE